MSYPSAQPNSRSPRVCFAVAPPHSFSQPYSILPGATLPARNSRFAYTLSVASSNARLRIGRLQGAPTASWLLPARLPFL
jgi:hypothetical protein